MHVSANKCWYSIAPKLISRDPMFSNRVKKSKLRLLVLILQEPNQHRDDKKNNERQQKLSAVIEWQWHRLHMLNGMLAFFTCTHSNNFRMFWHYFSLFSPNFHFVCSNSSLSRLHGDIVLASKIYVIQAIWFGSLSFSSSPWW